MYPEPLASTRPDDPRSRPPTHPPVRARHGRGRLLGAAALLVALAATQLPGLPAGATEAADEAALRAVVADATATTVTLTADVDLLDCAAGALTRASATPLTIEGGGFRVRQTCAGHRVLSATGGGGLAITATHLTGGSTGGGGGAVHSDGPVVVNSGSLIDHNTAHHGGAIVAAGSLTVEDSEISDNGATANGGALFADGLLTIRDAQLHRNHAGSHGGVAVAGEVAISGSSFADNEAVSGGVVQATNTVTVEDATFTGNRARTGHGGVLLLVGADAHINGSTFTDNEAAERGGAIGSPPGAEGEVEISDSRFEGNVAQSGGALHTAGTVTVHGSTLSRNVAGHTNTYGESDVPGL